MPVEIKSFYCRFSDTKHYGDDWTHIEATDTEAAAAVFAEQSDRDGDYDIVRRGNADCPVEVRAQNGVVTRWEITAEVVHHYYAEQEDATGVEVR